MTTFTGLTSQDASALLLKNGRNEIIKTNKKNPLAIFLAQFSSFLVLLLIVAAIVSFYFGEYIDAGFILVIVLLNGFLGFYQEYKADQAIEKLRDMTVTMVRVLRDTKEVLVPSQELVVGDVVFVEEGNKVPIDGVILETMHLAVNESVLTGESVDVDKNTNDPVFMGTVVSRGRGVVRVSSIGMNTKFGKISAELAEIDESETPLEKQLSVLGRYLGIGAIICCAIIFPIGLFKGAALFSLFLTSISLAVAAVPESLPAIVTITLGLGVSRMASRKAIIRKLSAVETLGATTVICTDKTGTLTTNQMRVREIWGLNDIQNDHSLLISAAVLCNSAVLSRNDRGEHIVIGDTTEGALLFLAEEKGVEYGGLREQYRVQEEFLFDSVRKMMSVVVQEKESSKNHIVYTKGAPEMMLARLRLSNEQKQKVQGEIDRMAQKGLRTLGFGYKELQGIDVDKISIEDAESDLIFIGLVGIADPPRDAVKGAIALARDAGVRTVMVTGDNVVTARAIGREIGLLQEGELALSGDEVRNMTDEELSAKLDMVRVFARAAPEDKLRIVRLFEKRGDVVAVTGDGVNDSLALKQADIGVAMGITGSDVAKEAADMVLSDDNYATIVAAIEEGRRIYRNIVKAVHYLVSTNIGEIIAILAAMMLFEKGQTPFTPLMILWMNLVTDGLPALGLATDTLEKDTMKVAPRKPGAQIIQKGDWPILLLNALLIAGVTLVVFWYGLTTGGLVVGQSYAFVAIVALQFVRVLTIRKSSPFNNPKLIAILVLSLALQLFVVSFGPTRELFGLM
ncbi:MAG: cation-translocating P-type ATPase [bacterium]|nr:cation-translocating P-type ATPase [bacterium]